MKNILRMLRHHIHEDYHPRAYLFLFIFISASLGFNYHFDFEDNYVDKVPELWRVPAKFFWFLIPYVTTCVLILPYYGKAEILKQKQFWVHIIFILSCMSFDSGFPIYEGIVKNNFNYVTHLYIVKVLNNLLNIPFIFLPALLFYYIKEEKNNFYGLTASFHSKPYLILLLLILPLLIAASQVGNFSNFYPMYKSSAADEYFNIAEKWLITINELSYAWNFLSVEFIFRGFLVIGMSKFLGRQAILPMVALYCYYHFGKPFGEAASSIFGGYILGVIAYNSNSILGGVILHVGVAIIMEILGFI